ncbi:multidrug resistance efflux pump [Mesorhizobium soli]|uniref:HlyD family secretion protein n=1 Tax=Pseudaminobacter soli (ex Li et al. 2025) TaxID=1295366 RepID=UPI002476FE8B|nr:HlyD family secretion protein [Mesorhizobium soli]MDH6230789.1 multidrug resistance efflux pump [Mesorhizobium soli]
MELLLILLYAAICIAIFKIFRIPVNEWTLSTAVLGGIVGLFALLLTMNYNHPYSANARIYYAVTPILPSVSGRVVEVPVETNVPLKQGDVLFKIDPAPYQYAVDDKSAQLVDAKQSVKELKAALDHAKAETKRTKSQAQLAQNNYDRQVALYHQNVIAKAALDTYERNLDSANQGVVAAQATEQEADLAYSANVGGVNTSVARLTAELGDAKYNLEQTTVRAPGPGFVTQVGLRPGMYVMPVPLRPAMTFVNIGEKNATLTAAFQENYLQRIHIGDDAEVAFAAVPGRVFKAKVRSVVNAIPAGELLPSGTLADPSSLPAGGGRALVIFDLVESVADYQIPLGSTAEVAVYTQYVHDLSLLRKILLRIKSWENYIFSEEHVERREH